jgi:HEAT repeat protein
VVKPVVSPGSGPLAPSPRGHTPRASDPVERAAAAAAAGHQPASTRATTARLVELGLTDADERVRVAALGALARVGSRTRLRRVWNAALGDPSPAVRLRAAELAPTRADDLPARPVVALLEDPDVTVVEAAAWALGEFAARAARVGAVAALVRVAQEHGDALAREAAVAALGAGGDPEALAAVLAACRDVATVRRRAVLALAPFEGPAVEAALAEARRDRDWQVRQAAEDLGATASAPEGQ